MSNDPSTNAQPVTVTRAPERKAWTKPSLDILAMVGAEAGPFHVNDRKGGHKSA